MKKEFESGVYETIYGNACEYIKGDHFAKDIDMAEKISLYMVDFKKFIRVLD